MRQRRVPGHQNHFPVYAQLLAIEFSVLTPFPARIELGPGIGRTSLLEFSGRPSAAFTRTFLRTDQAICNVTRSPCSR